jgi:hypothetical protein
MTYTVRNSRGSVITTISDVTVNTSTPINLIGRGVAGYGEQLAQSMYWMLENFAKDTAPATPQEGMIWYDTTASFQSMKYWDGSAWIPFATGSTAMGVLLSRLPSADNINFKVATSTNLHTGATGRRTMVTSLLLLPRAGASVTAANPPARFSLEVATSTGDIMDTVSLVGLVDSTAFAFYSIEGVQKIVTGGQTVKINITQAVDAADTLNMDAYLFGHVRA